MLGHESSAASDSTSWINYYSSIRKCARVLKPLLARASILFNRVRAWQDLHPLLLLLTRLPGLDLHTGLSSRRFAHQWKVWDGHHYLGGGSISSIMIQHWLYHVSYYVSAYSCPYLFFT